MEAAEGWSPTGELVYWSTGGGGGVQFQNFRYRPNRTQVDHVHHWPEIGPIGTLKLE